MSGTLFVVATPIGNLGDLTPRARQTLADVDLIAAEDTRHTGRLLSHIGAKTPQIALHDHNESQRVQQLVDKLLAGESIALTSDAGTPLISDPGYRLVRAARDCGVCVTPIPGASAALAALSVAGLASDRFCFEGFPPSRGSARSKWLQRLAAETRTLVFFESVHRVEACLADFVAVFGTDRPAFVGRELTKLHEQCVHAKLGELQAMIADGSIVGKGEFVIVVEGAANEPGTSIEVDALLSELAKALPSKQAAAIAARVAGLGKNAAYQRILELKKE